MKICTLCAVIIIGLTPQYAWEQTIPFSFNQIPGYEKSDHAVFSSAINPALLGSVEKTSAGIYSEMRYGLKEITHTAGSVVFPFSFGTFGAHILYTGNANFSESAFLFQYAKRLNSQKSYAGISFGLLQKKDIGYTVIHQYQAAVGLKLPLTEHIRYDVLMRVRQMQETEADKSIALDYQLGIGCRLTPQFDGSIQISKEAKRDAQAYLKGVYQLHKKAKISLVCATSTQELWAQVVFQLRSMQIGFSIGFHQMLGSTPGCIFMTKE